MIIPFFIHIEPNSGRCPIKSLKINKSLGKLFSFIFTFIPLLFVMSSCDKIPNGIVNSSTPEYKIISLNAPSSVLYSSSDSTITTSITIQNAESINKIWCAVKSLDGTQTISPNTELKDDGNIAVNGDQQKGDNIFSGKFGMSKKYSNGKYQIEYFIENNSSLLNVVKVGALYFTFDNSQINYAPVISNLVIPLSVTRGESFTFTIKVEDQNGLSDISQVYFKLIRPDGTTATPGPQDDNGSGYFLMHDDGNVNYGDIKSGDGIFSFKNSFGSTAQTGNWKFEFTAKDKGTPPKLSNQINANLLVN